MKIEGIDVSSLVRAYKKLDQFRMHLNTEQEKAGAIQAFEYTFELTWKTMKRILGSKGKSAYSPREVFRMAALEKFIIDPELWFNFLKMRNITIYTFEEENMKKVLKILEPFSQEVAAFLNVFC